MLMFLQDIVDRHSHLVTSIAWDVDSNIDVDKLNDVAEEDLTDEHKEFILEVERHVVEQLIDAPWFEEYKPRRLRLPGVLICQVVMECPNITSVDVCSFSEYDYGHGEEWHGELQDDALSGIFSNSFELESLKYSFNPNIDDQSPNLKHFMLFHPELKKVTVTTRFVDEDQDWEDMEQYAGLFESMAGLEHFEELSLSIPLPSYADAPRFKFRAPLRNSPSSTRVATTSNTSSATSPPPSSSSSSSTRPYVPPNSSTKTAPSPFPNPSTSPTSRTSPPSGPPKRPSPYPPIPTSPALPSALCASTSSPSATTSLTSFSSSPPTVRRSRKSSSASCSSRTGRASTTSSTRSSRSLASLGWEIGWTRDPSRFDE